MVEVEHNGESRTLFCPKCGSEDGFWFTASGNVRVAGGHTDLSAFAYAVEEGTVCKCLDCGHKADVTAFLSTVKEG